MTFLINVLQTLSDDTKDDNPEADNVLQVSSPASPPVISLLSPKAMETAGRILRFEEEHREKAKVGHAKSSLLIEKDADSTSPDWLLKSFGSACTHTAARDAGEAGSRGGECRVGAAETLRGVHGAEAEAGVSECEGHDGQRVRASNNKHANITADISFVFTIIKMFHIWNVLVF